MKRSRAVSSNLASLSSSMFSRLLDTFDEFTKAGKTNLMQGYASTMWMNNFLWSAKLIDDQAYQDVRILSTILQLLEDATLIPVIFGGNSPFAPTLRTQLEGGKAESKPDGGDDDEDKDLKQALDAAKIASLVSETVTAIG